MSVDYQTSVIKQQTLGTDYRVSNYRHSLSSEQSVTIEPPNSMNKQRVLLPLEPDFSTMSDPGIEIEQPINTWESNRSASLKRLSRRDQPKSKHKKRRYRSSLSSSSSPDRVIEETLNIHSDIVMHQVSKDSGSESEQETWSFDKTINEVFRLLQEEMCPRPSEDHTWNSLQTSFRN